MTRIIIVDEKDNPVGVKDRASIENADIYRVSALWITNPKGEILMAQRAFTKKNDPGLWGPAVAGTVDEGEKYDDNIVKEAFEEIGLRISIDQLRLGPKLRRHGTKNNYFAQWYLYTTDIPVEQLEIRDEEVARLKWFPADSLKRAIEEKPYEFIPSASLWAEHLL